MCGADYNDFGFFGQRFIYTKLANAWQTRPAVIPAGKQYEAGIVLGGFVSLIKRKWLSQ
jgi:hypothetical protein